MKLYVLILALFFAAPVARADGTLLIYDGEIVYLPNRTGITAVLDNMLPVVVAFSAGVKEAVGAPGRLATSLKEGLKTELRDGIGLDLEGVAKGAKVCNRVMRGVNNYASGKKLLGVAHVSGDTVPEFMKAIEDFVNKAPERVESLKDLMKNSKVAAEHMVESVAAARQYKKAEQELVDLNYKIGQQSKGIGKEVEDIAHLQARRTEALSKFVEAEANLAKKFEASQKVAGGYVNKVLNAETTSLVTDTTKAAAKMADPLDGVLLETLKAANIDADKTFKEFASKFVNSAAFKTSVGRAGLVTAKALGPIAVAVGPLHAAYQEYKKGEKDFGKLSGVAIVKAANEQVDMLRDVEKVMRNPTFRRGFAAEMGAQDMPDLVPDYDQRNSETGSFVDSLLSWGNTSDPKMSPEKKAKIEEKKEALNQFNRRLAAAGDPSECFDLGEVEAKPASADDGPSCTLHRVSESGPISGAGWNGFVSGVFNAVSSVVSSAFTVKPGSSTDSSGSSSWNRDRESSDSSSDDRRDSLRSSRSESTKSSSGSQEQEKTRTEEKLERQIEHVRDAFDPFN